MTLDILTLTDPQTGATARILPGLGFNCFSFAAAVNGETRELLFADPQFAGGAERPSGGGIPILFPFPGRLPGKTLEYGGKSYPMERFDPLGNAIHGFVLGRPWRVIEQTPQRAVGQFKASADDVSLLERWPADFQITAAYELISGRLELSLLIENPDTRPLPFGLGLHPYFRVPLGGTADACVVTAPADGYWELQNMMPTGAVKPARGRGDLVGGMAFGDMQLDDVFTKLRYEQHIFAATLYDPQAKRTLRLTFDDKFRQCVIYNPSDRQSVCIEPYTCAPDAYRLRAAGHDAGLIELPAGMTFAAKMEIELL